jgi:lipopolysaccharide/colanic/teichoic acid biosynthesis glycosyltransferase
MQMSDLRELTEGHYGKRVFDILITCMLLPVAAPVLLLCAGLIWIEKPGPVFFRQLRVGRNGTPFEIIKFRTMHDVLVADNRHLVEVIENAHEGRDQFKAGLEKRITRIGKFLRKSSLDELPQLLNVLRGEMSLVGPRPHTVCEVELFPPKYSKRHEVTPGMTGLWQVSGRNKLGVYEMLELDVKYVECRSIWMDLRILLLTVPAVLRFRDTG